MIEIARVDGVERKDFYRYLNTKLTGLICEETDWLASLANASALLYLLMEDINWAGFYLKKSDDLVLGPFQGKPACTHIPIGSGVCGSSAMASETLVVADVSEFPGHIACDGASRSEIVVPIVDGGDVRGVLDIDSPRVGRFDGDDAKGLEKFVRLLVRYVCWP